MPFNKAIEGSHDLTLAFSRVDGVNSVQQVTSSWNQARHEAAGLDQWNVSSKLCKAIFMTLQPDRWKPKDKKPVALSMPQRRRLCRLRLSHQRIRLLKDAGGVFFLEPKGIKKIDGLFTMTDMEGKATEGVVGGYLV